MQQFSSVLSLLKANKKINYNLCKQVLSETLSYANKVTSKPILPTIKSPKIKKMDLEFEISSKTKNLIEQIKTKKQLENSLKTINFPVQNLLKEKLPKVLENLSKRII